VLAKNTTLKALEKNVIPLLQIEKKCWYAAFSWLHWWCRVEQGWIW